LPWDSNHNARNIGPNERAIVVGWGRVTNNDPVTNRNYNQFLAASPTLQMLDVPVLDGQCKNDFNITSSIQVCAGGEPGIVKPSKVFSLQWFLCTGSILQAKTVAAAILAVL
jgi:hypothetical protein